MKECAANVNGANQAKKMDIIDPLTLIAEIEPYIRTGNDIPVERATIPAELLRRVIEALDICDTLARHAADCQASAVRLQDELNEAKATIRSAWPCGAPLAFNSDDECLVCGGYKEYHGEKCVREHD